MADTPRRRRGRREEIYEERPLEGEYEDFEAPRESSRRDTPVAPRPQPSKLITFAGGKGGMGASLLAANAGIYLAQMGNRVVLVDADLGAGNLHTLLGVEAPEETLADFISRKVERLDSIRVETRVPNLELIASARDPVGAATLKHAQRQRLLSHLSQIEADYVLVDAGSGVLANCLDLFLAARLGVILMIPEPTAVEASYRFLRAAFFRKLSSQKWPNAIEKRLSFMQDDATGFPGPMPRDLVEEAHSLDPEAAKVLERELWRFRPAMLVNQARPRADAEVGEAVQSGCRRKLGIQPELIGHIDFDDDAWISVRRRRPLLQENIEAQASRQIAQAVHRLLAALTSLDQLPPEPVEDWLLPPLEEQTHYEVLEIDPGSSEEEIRRAQKKMRVLYADDSIGMYGLYQAEEIEQIQRRLADAYDCLMDLDRRRAYDMAIFPEGHPGRLWVEETSGRLRNLVTAQPISEGDDEHELPSLQQISLPPDDELSGEWLRSVREARGVALTDIAARTKISLASLQWIEDEAFEKMSAPVYVRGFVLEYARYLRLDAERVARAYVDRYRSWLDLQAARMR